MHFPCVHYSRPAVNCALAVDPFTRIAVKGFITEFVADISMYVSLRSCKYQDSYISCRTDGRGVRIGFG
jgi:hypothetical protein